MLGNNALDDCWCCHWCCFLGGGWCYLTFSCWWYYWSCSRCLPLFVSCCDVGCSERLEFGCISAYSFPIIDSTGMDCGANYLCGNVDVRFEWGVSFAFRFTFQENRLSDFELVFFGSVSSVMVRFEFLFVFAVSFRDFFFPVRSLCWVVVVYGFLCSRVIRTVQSLLRGVAFACMLEACHRLLPGDQHLLCGL